MGKFREVRAQSDIYPCWSISPSKASYHPGPSTDSWRQGQKTSMATCVMGTGDRGQRRCDAKRKRHNLREMTDKKWSERRSEDNIKGGC